MRIDGEKPKRESRQAKPILRHEIEDAIANTKSNSAAARYLGVGILRYKKYAQIYGLYEQHNNKRGFGTPKGFAKTKKGIPLAQIFKNQHPNYSLHRLKNRLIKGKVFEEKCHQCGFKEKRMTDGKTPLMLTFKEEFRYVPVYIYSSLEVIGNIHEETL